MKKQLLSFKNLFLALGMTSLSLAGNAQTQVGNSDFETWQNVGSGTERPDNWNNIMNGNMCGLCGFGQIQTTWQEATTIHSGTYSVKIKTGKTFGQIVNGALTLGQLNAPSTTPTDGYNMTLSSDANFSEAITDRPDSIVFWANYSVTGSTDSARVSAVLHDSYDLHDPQDAGSAPYVVATARKNFQTGGASWVRMSIPFTYSGPASTVNYIIITFTSSYTPGTGVNGATLFIDGLSLIYNPKVTVAPTADQNLVVYQTGTTLTATETPTAATSRQWKYGSNPGGPYSSNITGETATTYTPMFTTPGTYYVVCESNFSGNNITSNEVKVVVADFTNSIAPTATQNLVENQAGTTLNVTETPTAASREWKYTTTSGSGYTSFAPTQTGTSYTPQFATAGTYYVVCQSTLYGNTITSNEVQIVVTAATSNNVSIAPTTTQNLATNQAGTQLTASETPAAASSREWKYTTTSGSAYTSFAPTQTGTTYTPQFATTGTYYVVCISDFGGGDIDTSNEVTVIVTDTTTGIVENAMGKILIYSTSTGLNVDLSGSSIGNATLHILALNGQVVATSSLNAGQMNTINTGLSTGIYFFTISSDKTAFKGKVYIK